VDTRSLLDQLLKSGQKMLQGGNDRRSSAPSNDSGLGGLGGLAGGLGGLLGKAGGGGMAASAIGMLLGSRSGRRMGGKALGYGGLAALGAMAYKAYSSWQAQQQTAPRGEPQTVDRVADTDVEGHTQAILVALVAAAKADGHVDDRERQLIETEFAQLGTQADLQAWLQAELNKPLNAAEVARSAKTTEMAAEMYLVSVMAVDDQVRMERFYLDELARELALDSVLKAKLEEQAKAQQ
jgi:uncharacterized membrane protein YebE (DUF533 family)